MTAYPFRDRLEQSSNVFALVVMAQLKAKRVKDGVARKDAKVSIIRLMYERGYSKSERATIASHVLKQIAEAIQDA